ncbi:MAG: tetratricopeptide repeat protein [Candidatus Omnitrophota bacterium]
MNNAEQYYRSGLKNNLLSQYDEAIADYSKAIECSPFFTDAYLRRGTLRYKILKKYDDALMDFTQIITFNSDSALAYLHRGIVKCHLLKFEDAMPDYDKSIELDPNDERAYLNRGKNKYVLKFSEDEVRNDLERAIRLGSGQAADMLELFYGGDQQAIRESISKGIQERARRLQK